MSELKKSDRIGRALQKTVEVASDLVEALEVLNGEFETYERNDQSLSIELGNAVVQGVMAFAEWVDAHGIKNAHEHSDKRDELILAHLQPAIESVKASEIRKRIVLNPKSGD